MTDPSASRRSIAELVALATRIEADSRSGLPVGPMLVQLRDVLADCERQTETSTPDAPDPFARMRRVIDQLTGDVAGGHVRSISGLTRQAQRVAHEVIVDTAAVV